MLAGWLATGIPRAERTCSGEGKTWIPGPYSNIETVDAVNFEAVNFEAVNLDAVNLEAASLRFTAWWPTRGRRIYVWGCAGGPTNHRTLVPWSPLETWTSS